jgi:hypothetical protein
MLTVMTMTLVLKITVANTQVVTTIQPTVTIMTLAPMTIVIQFLEFTVLMLFVMITMLALRISVTMKKDVFTHKSLVMMMTPAPLMVAVA